MNSFGEKTTIMENLIISQPCISWGDSLNLTQIKINQHQKSAPANHARNRGTTKKK